MLLAEIKSPTTIVSYLRGVRLYLEWCKQRGHRVELTRVQVQRYAAELIADGKEANAVRLRLAALRAFARWLLEEGELTDDPLFGVSHRRSRPRSWRVSGTTSSARSSKLASVRAMSRP